MKREKPVFNLRKKLITASEKYLFPLSILRSLSVNVQLLYTERTFTDSEQRFGACEQRKCKDIPLFAKAQIQVYKQSVPSFLSSS